MSHAVNNALIMIDGEGKVMFWNNAAERLFGYTAQEAMGMDFHIMAAPEKYHKAVAAGIARFSQTGEGAVLGTTTEITARNRDGEHFPVEVTLSSFQIDDCWYAVGMVQDITERKKAEEEIRKSRENFRIIADYTYDWEGWHDKEGSLLWVNPAVERITGFSVGECMNMPDFPLPLIETDDHEVWEYCLAQALKGQVGNDVPFRVRHKDGSQYWIALSWNPVYSEQGDFTGFRTSARDFTERKEAEDQLRFTQYTVDQAVQSIFWVNPADGSFEYVNDAACHSLGYERDELLNMAVSQIDLDFPEGGLQNLCEILRTQHFIQTEGMQRTKEGKFIEVASSISLAVHEDKELIIVFAKDISREKQAEQELLESEQRLDMALEGGNLGTWDRDFVTNHTVVDDRWASLLWLEPDQMDDPFQAWVNAIHPDDVDKVLDTGRRYREGEIDKYEVSYRVLIKGGELRWQTTKGKAMTRDENGHIVRMVGTVADVTAQKRAEDALKESEERSRLLLSSAGEGIFGVNTQDQITFINPAAQEMLGYNQSELAGKKVHELIHHTHQDGRAYPVEDCPMYATYTEGRRSRVDDEILWRKNGSSFPVSYSSTPIFKDSQVVGAVITFRDITERKQAEAKLKESEYRLEMALTSSNTGLWDFWPQTGEDFHNDQWFRQLGYERSDFPDESGVLHKLMHPGDKEAFIKKIDEYAEDGTHEYKMEFRLKAKDGSWKWIQSLGKVIQWDEQGKPVRIIGVHLDTTERKLHEQEMTASQQRLMQIIDFLPDPTWVIDHQSKVVAWNRALAKLTGIEQSEILGKGDHEYALPFYGERRPILIDLAQTWDESLQEKYLAVKRGEDGVLTSESFHPQLKKGTYLSGTARALYGPDGEPEGAIETVRDVTGQKKAEQELQQNLDELTRFSRLVVGREEKMILLKEEINSLMTEMGREVKYKIVE
jgi:PAS domain S-box-containing protein